MAKPNITVEAFNKALFAIQWFRSDKKFGKLKELDQGLIHLVQQLPIANGGTTGSDVSATVDGQPLNPSQAIFRARELLGKSAIRTNEDAAALGQLRELLGAKGALCDEVLGDIRHIFSQISGEIPKEHTQFLQGIIQALEQRQTISDEQAKGVIGILSDLRKDDNHIIMTDEQHKTKLALDTATDTSVGLLTQIVSQVLKSGGALGMIAQGTGFDITGNVAERLKKDIFDDKLKGCIMQLIAGTKRGNINQEGLTDMQKNTLHICDWAIWGAQKLPKGALLWLPRINYFAKWFMGALAKIPILGWAMGPISMMLEGIGDNADKIEPLHDLILKAKEQMQKQAEQSRTQAQPTPALQPT